MGKFPIVHCWPILCHCFCCCCLCCCCCCCWQGLCTVSLGRFICSTFWRHPDSDSHLLPTHTHTFTHTHALAIKQTHFCSLRLLMYVSVCVCVCVCVFVCFGVRALFWVCVFVKF